MVVIKSKTVKPTLKIKKTFNILDFNEIRNKVLITRSHGGLGDILMHRMLFENLKINSPDIKVHFSCPRYFHSAVSDHIFLDKLINSDLEPNIDQDYLIHYNTNTACIRKEIKIAPESGFHRSDIWGEHCGIEMKTHNMHIKISDKEKNNADMIIEENKISHGLKICICPISAMENKNLPNNVLLEIFQYFKNLGFSPYCLHNNPIEFCHKNNISLIIEENIRNWMSIIHQSDLIISVDTASFHCAGGMKKPTVGIFTFVNGETYSKYYEKAEVVQSFCPFGFSGCYNWTSICKNERNKELPCKSSISKEKIIESFNKLLASFF